MSSLLRKKFSSSQCKTLLQLTSQRLKLLCQTRHANAKKARADVARLLEGGQDSNAKIQVDVVLREEKIVAVYELLDQFCQLLISRLEIIKSQKECPSDLTEAVASLLFAAPRCAELVELQKVSKQFTTKYGTEFCIAAKELRPDCGVNKQVIQSLSTHFYDFNERLTLLKEIAVANNIKWDDENISADDQCGTSLLDGLSHFSNSTDLSEGCTSTVPDNSRFMHRNEVKKQHQCSSTTSNTETMHVNRAQKLPDGVKSFSLLDPYALARSQGKMDYKFVIDYLENPESSAGQEGRNGFPFEEPAEQGPSYPIVFSDASRPGDTPHRLKRPDVMDLNGRNGQDELSLMTEIAKHTIAAAANATEVARATVELISRHSTERSSSSKGERTNKLQELKSELSSGPVSDENHKLDMHSAVDRIEDSFKYVVFEQTSATERETKHLTIIEESNTDAELYAFPTPYAHRSSDRNIFDTEHDWSGSEGLYDDTRKGHELHETSNLSINQERVSQGAEVQQDKHMENDVLVPQFDDYYEEEDNYMHREASVPEVDRASSKDYDYMGTGAPMPQFDDHVSEDGGEEQEPFYLRGRAAICMDKYDTHRNEYDSTYAKNPASIVLSAASSSHYDDDDDDVKDTAVVNVQNSEKVPRLHLGFNSKEKTLISEKLYAYHDSEGPSRWLNFDEIGEPVSLPSQSSEAKVAGSIPVKPDPQRRLKISTDYAADSWKSNPVSHTDIGRRLNRPSKLEWVSNVMKEWDLDTNDINMGPPSASSEPFSRTSHGGRRRIWFSGDSEDSESMSGRSFEAHTQRSDSNFESPRWPLDTGDLTRVSSSTDPLKAAQQPSPRKTYVGKSVRLVRSTRSREG